MNAIDFKSHLAGLLRREHAALADFLLALAEFDLGRGWLELGQPSLFAFLHRELGLSKGAAYYRKVAADLVRSFPEVVEPIRDGRLCITSVVELAKVLTPENRAEVLPRFFHRSKQEAKAVSAELRPAEAAPHRDVVTTPARTSSPTLRVAPPAVHPDEPAQVAVHPEPATAPAMTAAPTTAAAPSWSAAMPRDVAEPLTADLRRLHVTVSRRFLSKLGAAKAALSHSHPGASSEEVLEAALDLLLAQRAKRKGIVEKPRRAAAAPARSETIPAAVKREVWTRAGGRCEWKLESGGTCDSTLRLELDHILPRAMGGPSTVENIRLICKCHNQLAARQAFGDAWMERFTRAARSSAANAVRTRRGGLDTA